MLYLHSAPGKHGFVSVSKHGSCTGPIKCTLIHRIPSPLYPSGHASHVIPKLSVSRQNDWK